MSRLQHFRHEEGVKGALGAHRFVFKVIHRMMIGTFYSTCETEEILQIIEVLVIWKKIK